MGDAVSLRSRRLCGELPCRRGPQVSFRDSALALEVAREAARHAPHAAARRLRGGSVARSSKSRGGACRPCGGSAAALSRIFANRIPASVRYRPAHAALRSGQDDLGKRSRPGLRVFPERRPGHAAPLSLLPRRRGSLVRQRQPNPRPRLRPRRLRSLHALKFCRACCICSSGLADSRARNACARGIGVKGECQ